MATITSTTFANNQPKGPHTGNISVGGQITIPATGTAPSLGDIGFLCKLPHGAVIVDMRTDHTCADTIGISFGLATGTAAGGGASFSALISAGAKATINRMTVLNTSGGVTVSVSDSDNNRYGILACKVDSSASLTASVSINWTVIYRIDGPPGQ